MEHSASGAGRKHKPLVFLVDDEPTLLDLLEASLQDDGYSLRKFLDPQAALTAFRAARPKPALLITDYALPCMSGLDLIEQCKADHAKLKTVMVSGTARAEIALHSPVKIECFVAKPYEPATLSALVRNLLAEDSGLSA